MLQNVDQQRSQMYFQLSSQLVQLDNEQLCSLFDDSVLDMGWGRHQSVKIGGTDIFLKRIPVTDVEYVHMFSTKNLYNLPTYYHYGIGSMGTGVFRELLAHIKTTNWVLNGESANFPLLYHYRIMPFFGEREEMDMEKHGN